MKTLYWHDYETWGVNPAVDRPSQFAGVRTDEALNIISEPLVLYCQPSEEILPNPEACLVTGITPQKALRDGLAEREFIAKIHRELARPNTCTVGYNSIRFDDEVTRYTLYRNFYDPYEREWKNGNSRWDIIDMARLVYALRPEGIEWPIVDGKPSFRLELLTEVNGIDHGHAHDAYSDVEATIHLARLIKETKPALYDYVYHHRSKHDAAKLVDIQARKPLLHISSRFSSEHGCAGLVVPLGMHPKNKNAVIAYDLSVDPRPLIELSAEAIHERVFTAQNALPEGQSRIPLKLIHLNKCPVLTTTKLLDESTAKRLGINKSQCERHWHLLKDIDLRSKLDTLYQLENFPVNPDPETQLYNGFIGNADKQRCNQVRKLADANLADVSGNFEDKRLNLLFERYQARNSYEFLSSEQKGRWQAYVADRLEFGTDQVQSIRECILRSKELMREADDDSVGLLQSLIDYAYQLAAKHQITINLED